MPISFTNNGVTVKTCSKFGKLFFPNTKLKSLRNVLETRYLKQINDPRHMGKVKILKHRKI